MKYSEFTFKITTSLFFRLVIVVYSFFLLFAQENIFPLYVYFIVCIVYFATYIVLFSKGLHNYRTISDFAFMTFVLLDKDVLLLYNGIFILFPLINSPNHTSNGRSPVLLFLLSSVCFLVLMILKKQHVTMQYLAVLGVVSAVFLLVLFEYIRSSYLKKYERLLNKLDDIVVKSSSASQVHGVLNEVKRHFKSDFKIDIDYIGVFEKNKNQEFIITSSSFFVYSYDIKEMISGLNKHTFANNFTALINEREYKNTIAVKVQQFYFLLAIGKNSAANGILIYMLAKDIFEPLFQKIIRVLKLEKSLSSQRYKIITNMNQKSQYVNDIMKSTHYMSNQLQPIKNYFDMLNNIQLYHNKREELQLILDDEKRRAENSLLNCPIPRYNTQTNTPSNQAYTKGVSSEILAYYNDLLTRGRLTDDITSSHSANNL